MRETVEYRLASAEDIDRIADIYDRIHDEEEAGHTTTGWVRSIYPMRNVAEQAVALGDMFVQTENDRITGAARINREQVHPTYDRVDWLYKAPPEKIMVLHTLTIDPAAQRHGLGKSFVTFYAQYARENGCACLRIDTNERNTRARHMYASLGFREAAVVPCVFNGIPGVNLVCLEKEL